MDETTKGTYIPSSGAELRAFEKANCSDCVHGDPTIEEGFPCRIMRPFFGKNGVATYPDEWRLRPDGTGECTAFDPAGSSFETKHFRICVNGRLLEDLSPNIGSARRLLANAIKGGGEGYVLEAAEMWRDKGATLDQVPLREWQ